MDPIRPNIKEAIEKCKVAGINVRMVTGDHMDTALAVSKEVGIVTDQNLQNQNLEEGNFVCMTGEQFRKACGGIVTVVDPATKS